jgi:multiple sugar transport system substrate-binding protein
MKYKAFLIMVVLSMLVAACASTPSANNTPTPTSGGTALLSTGGTPAASGQVIQLSFWHGQSQSQHEALNKLIDEFNYSHPDIHVTATYQGTYSDLYKKVTATLASGSPPDLAFAYQNDVANYIKAGAVIPLDDLMKDPQIGFTSQDLNDIYPSFIDHYPQFGDQVYSIAFMRSMEVMYYNADMLKTAGFDNPPSTWNEFMNICKAVSKPPNTYCYEMNTDASRFAGWIFSRGGDLINPGGKTVAFDSKAGLDTMNFIDDMFRNDYAIVTGKAFQDQTDFALGKIAFIFGSTAGLPYCTKAISDAGKVKNWGIAPDPHITPNTVVDVYGTSVTIFKTTTDKDRAAFIFLKWMMSTEADSQWVEATSYFPARQSTKAALADFIKANPLYGDALNWAQYGRTEPNIAAWDPIRGYIADAMTAVANGRASPEAALKDAANKANATISNEQ